jgi:hypothetical protein
MNRAPPITKLKLKVECKPKLIEAKSAAFPLQRKHENHKNVN